MGAVLWALLLVLLVFLLYFTPAITAGLGHHPDSVAIVVLNFTLGWTLIGWIVAMVWACQPGVPQAAQDRENAAWLAGGHTQKSFGAAHAFHRRRSQRQRVT